MEERRISVKKEGNVLKVILDSSFFFVPSQFNIDIFEGLAEVLNRHFKPIILSSTYKELQKIAESGSTKLRRQAAFALKLAQKCCQFYVEKGVEESHDDIIVRVASKLKCYVATNDRALRKRLRDINVPVIYLRQKSRLAVDGPI
ncbi:MAG: PIN domain-containing protein [Candidatus Bathyarchaeia archaeon]